MNERGLLAELKRRNVVRTALLYGVTAWLVIQIAETVLPIFAVPDWVLRALVLVLAIGALPVLVFAWVYEITPDGIRRESDIDPEHSHKADTGRKMDRLIVALMVILIGFLVADRWLPAGQAPAERESPVVAEETEPPADAAETPVSETPEVPDNTVAVLPFVNMSRDPDNEYFSDGLSETLLHLLAQVQDLRVAARTSAFKFKGTSEDVRLIGQQLSVAHILEGSVQKSGDRVRITAQLVKAEDGYHLWSATYDRTLDDIFTVQDEIAANVVEALKLTLLGETPKTEVVDVAVFEDFLRAQGLLTRGGTAAIAEAVDLLESVVEREPTYALAHARLAEAYMERVDSGALPEDLVPRAEAAALRAVEVDPGLAKGFAVLGRIYLGSRRPSQAIEALDRAVQLAPGDAESLRQSAVGLARVLRFEEALAHARQALQIDPLNAEAKIVLASRLRDVGRPEEGVDLLRESLALAPNDLPLLRGLSFLLRSLGRYPEALEQMETVARLDPEDFSNWQSQFEIYLDLGAIEQAGACLARMRALSEDRALDEVAQYEMMKGHREGYIEYLRRYAESRTWGNDYLNAQIAFAEKRYGDAAALLETETEQPDFEMDRYPIATLVGLAGIYHLDGRPAERDRVHAWADRLIEQRAGRSNNDAVIAYLRGMNHAAIGQASEAVHWVRRSIQAGYRNFSTLLPDHGLLFEPIRGTPEFEALREEIQALNRQTLEQIARRTDDGA